MVAISKVADGKPYLTPLKSIRKHCLECCGNKPSLVRKCDNNSCYLFPYKMGKNPLRKGIGVIYNLPSKKPSLNSVIQAKNGTLEEFQAFCSVKKEANEIIIKVFTAKQN